MIPKVLIEPIAMADILLAVDLNPVEISGLCQVDKGVDKDGDVYTIRNEPLILEQTCSWAHTDFLPAYAHWTQKMMREKRGPEINNLRLWWHSHVHGDAYFSKTDHATIDSWEDTFDEWWLSLVANKWGKMRIRLDIFNPRAARERDIGITNLSFTERTTTEEQLRDIMIARKDRMADIIARNVHQKIFQDSYPFETILRGVFHARTQTEHYRRR